MGGKILVRIDFNYFLSLQLHSTSSAPEVEEGKVNARLKCGLTGTQELFIFCEKVKIYHVLSRYITRALMGVFLCLKILDILKTQLYIAAP